MLVIDLIVLTCLCMFSFHAHGAHSATTTAPNILLILTDDMGNADASFNFRVTRSMEGAGAGLSTQSPPILTPNIDKLAENGIIFSNHYTQNLCALTRTALLTGRYAYRLGNPFPSITSLEMGGDLRSGYATFAHELQKRGYNNHFIGKYGIDNHNRKWDFARQRWNPPLNAENVTKYGIGPIARGFDTFYGIYGSAHHHYEKTTNGRIDWHYFNKTHYLDAPDGLDPEVNTMSTDIFVRETINVIKKEQNKQKEQQPWFIHLSFTAPHDPLMVDDKYIDKNEYPHCADKPNYRRKIFCGMIANVDYGIGQIVKVLEQYDILRNTIVIFSSDNGGFPFVGGYNYPYRGAKAGSYQGSVVTPAFIYAPNIFPHTSKHVFDGIVHITDWGPTLVSLVDQQISTNNNNNGIPKLKHEMGDIDGIDYSYVLKNFVNKDNDPAIAESVSKLSRNELVIESNGWCNMTSYIYNNYKLVLGFTGLDEIFREPDTRWTINSNDRERVMERDGSNGFVNEIIFVLPDLINYYVLSNEYLGMGPAWFMYEWAIIGFMGRLRDESSDHRGKSFVSTICRHPDGFPTHGVTDNRELYVASVNWEDEYERGKIRLYDLSKDRFEMNNIAFENRDIVDMMVARMAEKVEIERKKGILDLPCGIHSNLWRYTRNVLVFLAVVTVVIGLIVVCCVVSCVRRVCCGNGQKMNKIKKQ